MNPAPFQASAAKLDDGVHVIEVQGELDLSTAPGLERPLDEAVADTGASVLVDLTGCEFIDSTGIALLVRAWQQTAQDGNGEGDRRFILCSDSEQVRRVLEITGLERSIPIHRTRDEAIAALRA